MTTEQMKCFFETAKTGSFTEAAERLYMTQPSLSKKINALEQELDLTLFVRDKTRRTRLTAQGQVFHEGMQKLEQEYKEVLSKAQMVRHGVTGTVRLGIFESQLMDEYLQEILNDFARRYPQVELYVTSNSFNGLMGDLYEGKLDCAVTIAYDLVGRERLQHRTLYELRTYLVVPEQFLDDVWKTYTLRDFADKPFLTIDERANSFQDRMIREQTRRAGFEPEFIVATDEKNFMMLLEMGKGIAILDAYSKCCHSPNVRCISVPEVSSSPFDLVWTKTNRNEAFLTFLKYLTFLE